MRPTLHTSPAVGKRSIQFGRQTTPQEMERLEYAVKTLHTQKRPLESLMPERPFFPGFCFILEDLTAGVIHNDIDAIGRQLKSPTERALKGFIRKDGERFNIPQDIYFVLTPNIARRLLNLNTLGSDLELKINQALLVNWNDNYPLNMRVLWHTDDVLKTRTGSKILRFVFHVPGFSRPADTFRNVRKGVTEHLQALGILDTGQPITQEYMDTVIKPAWKKLVRRYHPDVNHNDPAAARQTVKINAAYTALGKLART